MGAFEYTAIDAQGKAKKGVLEADSPRQIRQQLRQQGLLPIDINAVKEHKINVQKLMWRMKRSISLNDLALLSRQLATLLSVGMPLEEALLAVGSQFEKHAVKSIILSVRALVTEGHAFAAALRNFPSAFPPLYCTTIAAGEQTGHLDTILSRLADYLEQQQLIRQKVQQALIYPAFILFFSAGIVTFLLTYIVPKMVNVFSEAGQSLPWLTQGLISVSNLMKADGIYIMLMFIGLLLLAYRLLKNERRRTHWHTFLLKMPILGYLLRISNTARFERSFGILLAAGVATMEAMMAASKLILILPMHLAVEEAIVRVREGMSIHYALKQTGYFTPMSLHLIASGEASGKLETLLERAAFSEEREVFRIIEMGLSLFEPVLIVCMGLVVLLIVLAVLLPIFNMDQFVA